MPKVQLGLKQIPVGIQGVELGVDAPLISQIRQPFPFLKDTNKGLLLCPGFSYSLVGNQRVGHFCERTLNCLLILHQRAVPLGFRQLHAQPKAAGSKDGLAQLWNETPGASRSAEKAGQLSALPTDKPAEAQLWEISGLGDAYVRVCGNQVLLRATDIGPPL